MPKTSQLNFSVTDLSFSIAAILKGISFVEGITKRGPFADAEKLITSWPHFLKVYGGFISNSDFPLLCRRAFDRGAQLRINRVGHYDDITDASTLDAVKSNINEASLLTFDDPLVADNQFDCEVNTNGITPIVFAVDSNTTMAVIAAEIAGDADVEEAFVVDAGSGTDDDRVIVIIPKDSTVVAITNEVITLGAGQAGVVASSPTQNIIDDGNNELFTFLPKYEGVDYNNLQILIEAASNGNSDYFNLTIQHLLEPDLTETYFNLTILGQPNITDSDYLLDVQTASQLVDVTYYDLSGLSGQLRPRNQVYNYISGSDGTTPDAIDYAGDAGGKNGFHAFNTVDDGLQLAVPELSTDSIHIAGAAYTASRKDINYYAHLNNSLVTASTLNTERDGTNIDTRFAAFFAGGLKILDPITSVEKEISEMGDILGVMAFNDDVAAEWFSPAGQKRGKILNALGVVNNFGAAALFSELNSLANHQINMVIVRNNRIYLVDAFTAQLANSKTSNLNIQRFLLFLQKSLGPTLENFLEEPLDVPLFKEIFNAVEPFLNNLITERALFSYVWQGDQDVDSIDDIIINNGADIDNGKYKVRLFVKIIPSLKDFGIEIIVTPTSTSFQLI